MVVVVSVMVVIVVDVCVCVRVCVTTRSAAELEGKNVCFVASPSNPRVVPSNEKSTIRFDFCYYRIACSNDRIFTT